MDHTPVYLTNQIRNQHFTCCLNVGKYTKGINFSEQFIQNFSWPKLAIKIARIFLTEFLLVSYKHDQQRILLFGKLCLLLGTSRCQNFEQTLRKEQYTCFTTGAFNFANAYVGDQFLILDILMSAVNILAWLAINFANSIG